MLSVNIYIMLNFDVSWWSKTFEMVTKDTCFEKTMFTRVAVDSVKINSKFETKNDRNNFFFIVDIGSNSLMKKSSFIQKKS